MDRRSFLKRIAIAAAGVAVGANLITDKVTASVPFKVSSATLSRINPAYVTAKYEESFIYNPAVFNSINPWGQEWKVTDRNIELRMPDERCKNEFNPYPRRFTSPEEKDEVYPFIEVHVIEASGLT